MNEGRRVCWERCLTNAEQSAKVIDAPPNMKLIAYLLIALALGYALAVFLDPSFPDILEIIDNPKF